MKAVKIIVGVAVLVVCGAIVANYSWQRNLQHLNFAPLDGLIQARVSEAVTLPAPTQTELQPRGALFETYSHAIQIAGDLAKVGVGGQKAVLSTKLLKLDPGITADAWGHPFCVVIKTERVGVFSAGPKSTWSDDCSEAIRLSERMLSLKPGMIFQYPSGALVLTLLRTASPRPYDSGEGTG